MLYKILTKIQDYKFKRLQKKLAKMGVEIHEDDYDRCVANMKRLGMLPESNDENVPFKFEYYMPDGTPCDSNGRPVSC
jgi:hypothetical protein